MVLKGMIGFAAMLPLGTYVMGAVGSASAIPAGIRGATQAFVGLGIMGKAASIGKKALKW